LHNSDRLPEALQHYDEAIAVLDRIPPELHYSVALVHEALGNTEEYLGHLQKIVAVHPDFADATIRLDKLSLDGKVSEVEKCVKPGCDNVFLDDAKFCRKCGTKRAKNENDKHVAWKAFGAVSNFFSRS
jgi:tetratricopeptide (TPR) repeat protein